MLLLPLDILQYGLQLARAHRKRAIPALPKKSAIASIERFDPFRRCLLHLLDQLSLGKICLAGAALALVCWLANYWWLDAWASLRFFQKLATLLIAIALAAMTFFAVAFWLRISEVQDIIDVFRSRFRRAL